MFGPLRNVADLDVVSKLCICTMHGLLVLSPVISLTASQHALPLLELFVWNILTFFLTFIFIYLPT
jgi:hypothetical protein